MKRFLARPTSPQSRDLLEAARDRRVKLDPGAFGAGTVGGVEKTDFAPQPFITGDDLTSAGLTPGPDFKRILDAVFDAQLEDRVKTAEAALELALKLAGQ